MRGKLKAFIESGIYWVFLIGTLVFMHVAESEIFDLPESIQAFADGIPRIVYPVFYSVLGLYVLRPFHREIREPRKLALILGILFVILLAFVKYADLPTIGFLNFQYLGVFLSIIVSGVIAACASAVMAAHDAEKSDVPQTGALKGRVSSAPLNKGLSWLWCRNEDHRNRELMDAAKSLVRLLFLMFIGINVWMVAGDLYRGASHDGSFVMDIAFPTVLCWAAATYVLVSVNGKNWAPNIDADRKLRLAFGANYDAQLDRELETKSLRRLLGENWFVRTYTQLKDAEPDNKRSAADY